MKKAITGRGISQHRTVFLASLAVGSVAALITSTAGQAHQNEVQIVERGTQRCILSNGLPDHAMGTFPRRGNPHQVQEQSVRLCVPKSPRKGTRAQKVRGSIGVALNGVQIRPGTADWDDAGSRRGFSRNPSSGWNLEGIGARDKLGMDRNNAHVDERGLYHYHGVSRALTQQGQGSLIGYAADGFEIHYVGKRASSSYMLRTGTRPSAPGGRYDGTYNQDWAYAAGRGSLDECNGGRLNGKFVYFATDTYPFFPRCLWGRIGSDFLHGRSVDRGRGGQKPQGPSSRPDRPGVFSQKGVPEGMGTRRQDFDHQQQRRVVMGARRQGPPQEALLACARKERGRDCQINTPHGHQLNGICDQVPTGELACKPEGGRRPPRR